MITPVGVSAFVLAGAVLWRPVAGLVLMAVWCWNKPVPGGPSDLMDREVIGGRMDW
jgi:hypothetical protein